MNNLEHIARQLVEMITLAKEANQDFLVYLLEMALAETYDEIRERQYDKRA